MILGFFFTIHAGYIFLVFMCIMTLFEITLIMSLRPSIYSHINPYHDALSFPAYLSVYPPLNPWSIYLAVIMEKTFRGKTAVILIQLHICILIPHSQLLIMFFLHKSSDKGRKALTQYGCRVLNSRAHSFSLCPAGNISS